MQINAHYRNGYLLALLNVMHQTIITAARSTCIASSTQMHFVGSGILFLVCHNPFLPLCLGTPHHIGLFIVTFVTKKKAFTKINDDYGVQVQSCQNSTVKDDLAFTCTV